MDRLQEPPDPRHGPGRPTPLMILLATSAQLLLVCGLSSFLLSLGCFHSTVRPVSLTFLSSVGWGGVGLVETDCESTWYVGHSLGDDDECGAVDEMRIGRGMPQCHFVHHKAHMS
jgi:hypothetical protein